MNISNGEKDFLERKDTTQKVLKSLVEMKTLLSRESRSDVIDVGKTTEFPGILCKVYAENVLVKLMKIEKEESPGDTYHR